MDMANLTAEQRQRMALWAAEPDIDDLVDPSLAIGNYGQSGHFEDGMSWLYHPPW
jgi:hypothetical protein